MISLFLINIFFKRNYFPSIKHINALIYNKSWTVEKAINYMQEKTGMNRHQVSAECYRYEAWPGQACAYKLGEIAIWRCVFISNCDFFLIIEWTFFYLY
jgi:hypothetical protein